jgi:hypothetical protein
MFLEVVTQAPRIPPLAPRSYTVHPRELEVSGNYDSYSWEQSIAFLRTMPWILGSNMILGT